MATTIHEVANMTLLSGIAASRTPLRNSDHARLCQMCKTILWL